MGQLITKREKEIFQYLVENKTTNQIATILNISPKTVRNHISNVILKLDVKGRTQAILKLIIMDQIIINKNMF